MINQNINNMKTIYQKPNTKIVMLKHQAHILVDSIKELVSSEGLKLGGKSASFSRSRSYDDWDDEDF